ncbi:MAG: HEAT repeat domain-containing protein [Planctomycetota bacterium]
MAWIPFPALCIALLPCAASQSSEPAIPTSVLEQKSAAPAQRAVVHLRDGRILRTLAEQDGAHWLLGKGNSQVRVPGTFVEQVVPEAELLKQWKALSKAPDLERIAFALPAGLWAEGLPLLDRALGEHATYAAAQGWLERYRHLFGAPGELSNQPTELWQQLCDWHKAKPVRSVQVLAAECWAAAAKAGGTTTTAPETDPWRQALHTGLTDTNPTRRSLALWCLRSWKDRAAGDSLQRFAMLDPSDKVRSEAAWLVGNLNDPSQIADWIAWLGHTQSDVRVRAAQALGQAGYPAAVPALVASLSGSSGTARRVPHANIFVGSQTAYLQDFSPEIANSAQIADPEVGVLPSGAVLDVGILGIRIEVERTWYRRSLQQITGHRPGANASAWNRFLSTYPAVDPTWRAPWPAPSKSPQ